MANPINAQPTCLQGRPLPSNWRAVASSNAKQAEAAYLDRLQNAWRNAGSAAQQNMPPMRAARLTNDSADYPHNGPKASGPNVSGISGRQDRCDGTMKLIYDDGNGNQRWADEFGNTCWIKKS